MAEKVNIEQTTFMGSPADPGNTSEDVLSRLSQVESDVSGLGAVTYPTFSLAETSVSTRDVLCKSETSNEVLIADKRYNNRIEILGFSNGSYTSGQDVSFIRSGTMNGFTGLTIGRPLFLSNSGGFTQNDYEVLDGEWRIYLGFAIAADTVYVDIGEPIKITSGSGGGALSYDTGWIANSDWANAEFTINHNLDTNLSDLIVKFFISTDGTEANAFEINLSSRRDASGTDATYGLSVFNSDSNNIKVQTGAAGLTYAVDADGSLGIIESDSYYYKIKIYKPSTIIDWTGNKNEIFVISDTTDINYNVPSASGIDFPIFIKRVGTGSGIVNWSFESGEDKTGVTSLEGDGGYIELISDGSYWYIKDYWDSKEETAGWWEKRGDGTLTQWGSVDVTRTAEAHNSATVTFPKEFNAEPIVQVNGPRFLSSCSVGGSGTRPSTTQATLYISEMDGSTQNDTTPLLWHAIGRWK